MTTSFNTRVGGLVGGHVVVSIFSGPDADHRALAGTVTMLPGEAADLATTLSGERERVALEILRSVPQKTYRVGGQVGKDLADLRDIIAGAIDALAPHSHRL